MKSVSYSQPLAALLFLTLLGCLFSCKKEKGRLYFREISATAVLSNGQVINFNVNQPPQANLGNGWYGLSTFVSVTNEANAQIHMSVTDTSSIYGGRVNQPGTYPSGTYQYDCHFIPNNLATPTIDYSNEFAANPGTITFTQFENNYMEGYFSAVCKRGMDSVVVSGTFKGEY